MLRAAMAPALRLYKIHGSHPVAAVEQALALKGLRYKVVEWPPRLHAPVQRLLFGSRTVPALTIDRSEKISGSRAIMRRLDQLVPEPLLYPADPARRQAVEDAERWGDEVLQPIGRSLIWPAMQRSPAAMVSYSKGSRLPLPAPAIKLSAPLIARLSSSLNRTNLDVARQELTALPGHLDKVDALIADGTIGDPQHPNAADLQIGATIRLLMTLADVRPLIEERPAARLVELFPPAPGLMPAGSLPAVHRA